MPGVKCSIDTESVTVIDLRKKSFMSVNIPTEFLNRLINLGGVKKSLRCDSCEEFTEHISVSWAEVEKETFYQIIGRLSDMMPTQALLFGNPFACSKCGLVRHEGGFISDWYNKGNFKRLKLKQ